MADTEEENIIKGCIRGDRHAQNLLHKRYSGKMFAVCLRYARTHQDAEDIFHEGLMKVYEHIKKFRDDGSFEGWIRRIMVNTAIELYRKQSPLSVVIYLEDYKGEPDDKGQAGAIEKIEETELLQMIRKLPPAYRMVFNLYVFEGLKHREIAVKLKISEGTSKSNLHDARAQLQKALHAREKQAVKISSNG